MQDENSTTKQLVNEDSVISKQSMTLDTTECKQAEEALQRAYEDLERMVEERMAELVRKNQRLIEEVEERKRAEEALRESEEKYRNLVDHISIGVALISPNMEIVTLNNQMKKWFPDVDVSKRPICYKVFNTPPSESICSYCPTHKTLQDGQVHESVTETPSGGQIRNFRIIATPIKDIDGKVVAAIEMMEDITDSKNMQERLLESEIKYRTIFETTPCAIMIVEEDNTISLVNSEFEKLSGYSKGDIEGKRGWTEFVVEDDLPRMHEYHRLRRTDPNAAPRNYEFLVHDREKHTRHAFATIAILPGTTKSLVSLLDITSRKRAEEELRRANEYLEDVFENSPDGIGIVNANGKFIKWNKMAAEQYGYTVEELKEKSAFDLYADKDELERMLTELRRKGAVKKYAIDMKKKGGEIATFEISISLLKGDAGETLGSVCVARDVTERKRTEDVTRVRLNLLEYAASHSLEELLQKTLDEIGALTSSPVGFYHFMESDQKTLSLQAWSTRTVKEFCTAEGKGMHYPTDQAGVWVDCVHERRPVMHNDYLELPHRKGMPEGHPSIIRELVVPIMRSDQIVAILGIGNKPVNYTENDVEIVSYLADVAWEIVERKRAEEELCKYRDQLENLVKERTTELAKANEQLTREIEVRRRAEGELQESSQKLKLFAYSVAHDLKSPTIGIHGLTRRLHKQYKDIIDEKGRTYCDQIMKASEHIAALVEKINLYIATKESTLTIENIHLREILQTLKDEFSAQLSIRRIHWHEPESTVEFRADRHSILRCLRNLLDNSLKYGGARLSRIRIGHEESKDFHILSVSDNGRGLKREDTENIFRPFERCDTSKGVEGAGLGLTIVREITEQHGGKVWAEPGDREGIVFHISISKSL